MISTRRQFIRGATLSAATLAAPGAFAQALATAVTGDGPYYPTACRSTPTTIS